MCIFQAVDHKNSFRFRGIRRAPEPFQLNLQRLTVLYSPDPSNAEFGFLAEYRAVTNRETQTSNGSRERMNTSHNNILLLGCLIFIAFEACF